MIYYTEVQQSNTEAAYLDKQLGLEDRIDRMALETAFITIKDHKPNFPERLSFRLINPAKSQVGKISKIILERLNKEIREKLCLNQWKSSNETLDWYKNVCLNNTNGLKFIQCDIANFYPSISEKLVKTHLGIWPHFLE